ncbi:hypothetical protein IV38_GL000929 [Lactobacillus selangorensis]|uniref:Helicase ATP-binding domain-containing protein n=1 Tax=Lactobacillus selangorensis TaxID=81857 RepID=A0A0R2FWY3_9LACO|nr:hypothetical protein [Lactobacillus selangorensis]KRN28725.1 hypothetical protein IV38_GL000929 [Lactobacillus selangorensis]KRN32865.1 hypothetical protein IV40_GL000924 [Lactobacillus selangorensis]
MNEADFEALYAQLIQNGLNGNLLTLDAPTGSGKTHQAINFICRQVSENREARFYFVSDQKKNLNTAQFHHVWCSLLEAGASDNFYQRFAIVRSLTDSIQQILQSVKRHEMPAGLFAGRVPEMIELLDQQFKIYQSIQETDSDASAWNELKKAEYRVRQALAERLAQLVGASMPLDAETQEKIRVYVRTEYTPEANWMNQYYPTVDLAHRQVYIMTTDKFIRSYTDFFEHDSRMFQLADFLQNALVIIDEFDATKQRLWTKAIEDALKIKADLLSLFKTIHQGMEQVDQLPSPIQRLFVNSTKFNQLKQQANDLQERYRLDRLYKTTVAHHEEQSFLIHTPQTNLISNNQSWHSHFNAKTNSVEIGPQPENELHFYSMLNQLAAFIRRFTLLIRNVGSVYQSEHNQTLKPDEIAMDSWEACHSVYDALGLGSNQIDVLLNLGLDLYHPKTKQQSAQVPDSYRRFQKWGLSFFYFSNAERHDLRTDINAAFFSVTPERYLLSILNKANVLGLSATATFPTVLDNYDLDYLKEQLGNHFIKDGCQYLTPETLNHFNLKQRYQEHGVQINVDLAAIEPTILGMLQIHFPAQYQQMDPDKITQLDERLQETVQLIHGRKKGMYFKQRYVALFDSFVRFLVNPELTSYLGLQSLLPRSEKPEMDLDLVQDTFAGLADLLQITPQKRPHLKVIQAQSQEKISEQLKKVRTLLSKGTRVYLLSAYQTIGVGQNLQHPMSDFERSHVINIAENRHSDDQRQEQVDLAGMYLGEVTHY